MTFTRSLAAVAGFALFLGACSTGGERAQPHGTVIAQPKDFFGAVAADDPRAAQIGRDILRRGGTAADAATAMYFVMVATLPSRVGLGAGGACLIRDGDSTAVLDFPIVAGAQGGLYRRPCGRWRPCRHAMGCCVGANWSIPVNALRVLVSL